MAVVVVAAVAVTVVVVAAADVDVDVTVVVAAAKIGESDSVAIPVAVDFEHVVTAFDVGDVDVDVEDKTNDSVFFVVAVVRTANDYDEHLTVIDVVVFVAVVVVAAAFALYRNAQDEFVVPFVVADNTAEHCFDSAVEKTAN